VSENQAAFPIATMCRLLGVSPYGYYAWTKRPTVAACANRHLAGCVNPRRSRGVYGAPRIHVDLAAKGIRLGRMRITRPMSEGPAGVSRRKFVTIAVGQGDPGTNAT
jgi:putative transposase